MIEVADHRSHDGMDQHRRWCEAEEGERQIEPDAIDDELEPMEAKRDDPVHLAIGDGVMGLVQLPEPRHAVQQVVDEPLREIEQHERDADLHPQRPLGGDVAVDDVDNAVARQGVVDRRQHPAHRERVQ
jgi:hypothetical protein